MTKSTDFVLENSVNIISFLQTMNSQMTFSHVIFLIAATIIFVLIMLVFFMIVYKIVSIFFMIFEKVINKIRESKK